MAKRAARRALDPALVPKPVRDVLAGLAADGFLAVLVGGAVRAALQGSAVHDFDVATSADPEAVLARFPHAIPIGLRHGTVMIPTAAGPVDVTHLRGSGGLEADLALRDFTINAIAWDLESGRTVDPFGGAEDLSRARLRAVGSAPARMAEDPLRALRAARLVAQLRLEADDAIEPALRSVRERLPRVARERVRRELERLLLVADPSPGLALLRTSGIEGDWAPGARADAGAVAAHTPALLRLRLAAWLRGTDARAVLDRLHYGRKRAEQVAALVARHPVDGRPPRDDRDVRRLLRRLDTAMFADLRQLRAAEIHVLAAIDPGAAEAADARLTDLAERVERITAHGGPALGPADLALRGRDVMRLLGIQAGPEVGAALEHLTGCAIEDPGCNTPERLTEALRAWARRGR